MLLCLIERLFCKYEGVRMKSRYYSILFLLSFFVVHAEKQSAVTFYAGGRLGDKLMVYVKAKWFAYKYNLPFLCSDFEFQEKFALHEKDNYLKKGGEKEYKHKVVVKKESDIDPLAKDTLFVVDFYVKSPDTAHLVNIKQLFLNNPDFHENIKATIAPCEPITPINFPDNYAKVAVHVRRGSGGDLPLLQKDEQPTAAEKKTFYKKSKKVEYMDVGWPTKFPPDDYYIKQIKRLSEILEHKPMYVFIFTDYAFPEEIASKYQNALNMPNIIFDWRRQGHDYKKNIIEDLFALSQFDYLIRSISSYSGIGFLMGNHTLVFAPAHAEWLEDRLIIDKVLFSSRNEDGTYLRQELDN